MDLWIRSQDRKDLVAIDGRLSITRVPTEKYNVEDGYRIEHFSFLLGIYKTEERALEVLDEIQDIIRAKCATSFDYEKALSGFEKENCKYMLEKMAVYEMPKE